MRSRSVKTHRSIEVDKVSSFFLAGPFWQNPAQENRHGELLPDAIGFLARNTELCAS